MMLDQKLIDQELQECRENKEKISIGPWTNEPDRELFKYKGLMILLRRNPKYLAWCGYVGVDKNNPYYGRKNLYMSSNNLEVHGGITYSAFCNELICHPSEDDDKLFWIGFDCIHGGDYWPFSNFNLIHEKFKIYGLYRDYEYVKKEAIRLADQLLKAQNEGNDNGATRSSTRGNPSQEILH